MGIDVNLYILPERLDPHTWHTIYDESVALLKGWPLDILGLRREQVEGVNRLVYSSNIERKQQEIKKRHWKVEGDQQSLLFAETFELYYDLDRYLPRSPHVSREEVSLLQNLEMMHAAGTSVFDSKTQGYPYHEAMLAVAMLVEDAFPNAAIVTGNITLSQVRKSHKLIMEILGKNVQHPLCVDGERLFPAITHETDGVAGLRRFLIAFSNSEEAIRIMQQHVSPLLLRQCYAQCIKEWSEPGTLGFQKNCMNWLNATDDL